MEGIGGAHRRFGYRHDAFRGIGEMTDVGWGDQRRLALQRLQMGRPGLDTNVRFPANDKMVLANQFAFQPASIASPLTGSAAPAQAPATDARA
jgi:hypothetical protein